MSDIVKELGGMFFHNNPPDADFADILCDSWLFHGCWGHLLKCACHCRCHTQPLMQLLLISRVSCSCNTLAGATHILAQQDANTRPLTHKLKIPGATLTRRDMHTHS